MSKQDIIKIAFCDVGFNNTYVDRIIVLSKKSLELYERAATEILLQEEKIQKRLKEQVEWDKYDKKMSIPIENVSNIDVNMVVNGGLLYATVEDKDVSISLFSNSCMTSVKDLIKEFCILKNKEVNYAEDEDKYKKPKGPPTSAKCKNKKSVFLRTLSYYE